MSMMIRISAMYFERNVILARWFRISTYIELYLYPKFFMPVNMREQ